MSVMLPVPTCLAPMKNDPKGERHVIPMSVKNGILYCNDERFITPGSEHGIPQSMALWAANKGGAWNWRDRTLVYAPATPDAQFRDTPASN